jgi:hypothetical protein
MLSLVNRSPANYQSKGLQNVWQVNADACLELSLISYSILAPFTVSDVSQIPRRLMNQAECSEMLSSSSTLFLHYSERTALKVLANRRCDCNSRLVW